MAMTYVSSSSGTGATGAANITITKPTGLAVDDVMIVALTANKNPWTVPSGFTQLQTGESAANAFRSYLYYKVATSTDVAATNFTFSGSDGNSPLVGTMIAIRGCNPSNPIMDSDVDVLTSVSSGADPGSSITVTRSAIPSRILMWRTDRNTNTTSGTFSESSGGWDIGVQAVGGTGGTRYGSCVIYTGDFGSLGDTTGPAGGITHSTSTTDNVFFMVALSGAVPADGSITSTLPKVTSSLAGSRVMPDGPIDAQLPKLTTSMVGTAAPPSGSISTTLPKVTSSLAGSGVGGVINSTLPKVTSQVSAGVEPVGPIAGTLPSLSVSIAGESRLFGEHVILVEPEKRAFRVTQDDMKAIYLSQVTQE